jgi:UDPglucose--hexose-1-phosphate uridylyltransferase
MKAKNSGQVEFKREIVISRMLRRDTSGKYIEDDIPVEFRTDPLTGRTCRVVRYSTDRIVATDLAALDRKSRELGCPFCPGTIDKITPQFPPDLVPERVIRRGKAIAFPNTGPYDVYGIVVVMSDKHLITLKEFDLDTVFNALLAAQDCLKRFEKADAEVKYHFIAWNYMMPSGGSLVHPHLQCNAGYFPTNYQQQILEASDKYFKTKGTNYWSGLLEQEKQSGERYIGKIGNTEWLTSFVPKGRLVDALVLFPGKTSVTELTEADLSDFAAGMIKVFRYIDGLRLISFNMSTYSGFDNNRFWAHARITPRGLLLYSPLETSDQYYYQIMHDENICIIPPENACTELKKHFSS